MEPMRRALFAALALLTACSLAYPLGDKYTRGDGAKDGALPDTAEAETAEAGPAIDGETDPGAPDLPMLVYASSNGQLRIRRYDPATKTFTAPVDGPSGGAAPIFAVTLRRSPVDGSRVLGVFQVTTAEPHVGTLHIYEWNGTSFVEAWTASDVGKVGYRPFDIAFSRETGRAIVVYGSEQGNPHLRIRDANGWGPEQLAFPKAIVDDWFDYIDLATREGTDDVAVIYQSNIVQIAAARMVGDRFNEPTLLTSKGNDDFQRCVAGAFEQKSGDFVAVWSTTTGMEWSVTPAGQPSIAPKSGTFADLSQTGHVVAAPQPGQDRIAFALLEDVCNASDCDDFTTIMWNGASFDSFAVLDTDITTPYADLIADAPSALAWSGDDALALYHRSASGFRWGRWRAGWKLQNDYEPATPIGEKANFIPFRAGDDLLMLVEDKTGSLWAARYDGTGWTDAHSGALATDLTIPTAYEGHGVRIGVDGP